MEVMDCQTIPNKFPTDDRLIRAIMHKITCVQESLPKLAPFIMDVIASKNLDYGNVDKLSEWKLKLCSII